MPAWVNSGFSEYARRLPAQCALELREVALIKRTKNTDTRRAQLAEGTRMLDAVGRGDRIVALEVNGHGWSTETLAQKISSWSGSGCNVSLLVGGPEGMLPEISDRAELKWSLSPLTLPHPLVRIVVAEQIYRAWTILEHHPYHR